MIGQSLEEALHFVGERSRKTKQKKTQQLKKMKGWSKKKKKEKSRGLSFLIWRQASARKCSLGFCSVVGLLYICVLAKTRGFEVFLQHMSICRLYPLVVVFLRLNDLKAKLSVEVNCGLIADLDVPGTERRTETYVSQLSAAQYSASTLRMVKDNIEKELPR